MTLLRFRVLFALIVCALCLSARMACLAQAQSTTQASQPQTAPAQIAPNNPSASPVQTQPGLSQKTQAAPAAAQPDWAAALAKYQQAYERDKGAQSIDAADDVFNIGICYSHLGQAAKANDSLDRALLMYRKAGDRASEANVLAFIGSSNQNKGQYKNAIHYYQQCRAIRHRIKNADGEAWAKDELGECYYSLGQFKNAIVCFSQAQSLYGQVGDISGEGASYSGLGDSHCSLSEFEKAIGYLGQALKLFQRVGYQDAAAKAAYDIGYCRSELGQLHEALGDYKQALSLYTEAGDDGGRAKTLENIDSCQNILGQQN